MNTLKEQMMMKICLSLLVGAAAMMFTLHGHSTIIVGTHQQNDTKTEKPIRPRKGAIKQRGWRVPGINEYRTVSKVIKRQVNGIEVTIREFKADARPVVDLDSNTVGNIDRHGINVTLQMAKKKKRLFDVRDFATYEINGRVFAYGVSLVPVVVEETVQTYAGAMYKLFYFDEDGDGRFETRYSGSPLPKIPEWVRATRGTAERMRLSQ